MTKNKKIFSCMAFGATKKVEGNKQYTNYIGLAPVKVLSVNPNKEEIEKITEVTQTEDPVYILPTDKDYKRIKIDFYVKTVPEKCDGIDVTTRMTFFMEDSARYNKDRSKVQVIDKYGRTAWVTPEEFKIGAVPTYSNGPAKIGEYRAAYVGEENIVRFLKTLLGIENIDVYKDSKWVENPIPTNCECQLDHIKDYFTGKFSELQNTIKLQPDNIIKVLFGVRITENGTYQTIYTEEFISGNYNKYDKLKRSYEERKTAETYRNAIFDTTALHEYKIQPTEFKEPTETTEKSPWE